MLTVNRIDDKTVCLVQNIAKALKFFHKLVWVVCDILQVCWVVARTFYLCFHIAPHFEAAHNILSLLYESINIQKGNQPTVLRIDALI